MPQQVLATTVVGSYPPPTGSSKAANEFCRLVLAPDGGMKYLARDVAFGKLVALGAGARAVRSELS